MKTLGIVGLLMLVIVESFALSADAQEKLWNELNEKVNILYEQGRYSEAVKPAEEALKIAENTFGPDHPNVAISLNNLATLYRLGLKTGSLIFTSLFPS